MSDHNNESLQKRLAPCEPWISESLADDVLRDVDAVLNSPKQRKSQRFNAQVHCTKKSRCRSTFLGVILGVSLGLLIGVTITLAMLGHRGQQIVYVEVPVETPLEKPAETETPPQKPERTHNYGHSQLARAETNREPISELDRLIEETIAHKQRIVIPDSLRSQYVEHRYTSSAGTILPDQNLLLLQRELLENYQ